MALAVETVVMVGCCWGFFHFKCLNILFLFSTGMADLRCLLNLKGTRTFTRA